MAKDYVLLKIDTERHTNGAQVAKKLRGVPDGSIPWMVITDAKGQNIITSDRPTDAGSSNIGCPVSPDERAWFMTMLSKSTQHMSAADQKVIAAELAIFAKE